MKNKLVLHVTTICSVTSVFQLFTCTINSCYLFPDVFLEDIPQDTTVLDSRYHFAKIPPLPTCTQTYTCVSNTQQHSFVRNQALGHDVNVIGAKVSIKEIARIFVVSQMTAEKMTNPERPPNVEHTLVVVSE